MLENKSILPEFPVLPAKIPAWGAKRWIAQPQLAQIPPEWRIWLTDRGSLTAKLKQHCQRFHVELLQQRDERPLPSELHALKLPQNSYCWVRTVLLYCDDAPVVYARTVIPHMRQQNPWQALRQLGNQPLGELLFQLPNIQRTPFEYARHTPNARWPHLPDTPHTPRYARRCQFHQKNAPLLLTELFLKEFQCLI